MIVDTHVHVISEDQTKHTEPWDRRNYRDKQKTPPLRRSRCASGPLSRARPREGERDRAAGLKVYDDS